MKGVGGKTERKILLFLTNREINGDMISMKEEQNGLKKKECSKIKGNYSQVKNLRVEMKNKGNRGMERVK